jgi:hypothetical protein
MTTAQTSTVANRGQVWQTCRHRRGACGGAPEVSPGRSVNSPVPGRSSGIAARPEVAQERRNDSLRGALVDPGIPERLAERAAA